MNGRTIAVSISTVVENESRIRDFFSRNAEALGAFDQVILVMQGCSPANRPQAPPNTLRNLVFEPSQERGLSRSRNRALDLCSCDYLWILDDDVLIEPSACESIRKAIQQFPTAGALTFEFADISDRTKRAKRYPPSRRLGGFELLRVSSIEIVVWHRFVKEKNLRFDTRYGLGAWIPSGEETVFLLDLHRAGAEIAHSSDVIVLHPLAGRNVGKFWRMPRRLYGMGTIAKRFGIPGLALVFRWAFRGLRSGLPLSIVCDLFRGYFIGKLPEK